MKTRTLTLLLLSALLAASCAGDYRCAKQFIRKHRWNTKEATEKFYVCLPSSIYRTNSSPAVSLEQHSSHEADSLLALQTRLLDTISDSLFLAHFRKGLISMLECIKVPIVVVGSEDSLPPPSRDCLILDVAALEAEEFIEHARSSVTSRRGVAYHVDHDLRHFSANGWFQMNYDTAFYFLNQEVSEQAIFQGTVLNLPEGKASMRVEQRLLQPADAYRAARSLGETCAVMYIGKF